jgi:hypothetical protein
VVVTSTINVAIGTPLDPDPRHRLVTLDGMLGELKSVAAALSNHSSPADRPHLREIGLIHLLNNVPCMGMVSVTWC